MRVRAMLLATAITALPLGAQAQPVNGLYVSGGAGVNIMQNEREPISSGFATPDKSLQFIAVAAELVRDGVPKSAIAIQGFGETHLLVPTGPGVREPQNRHVEIIIK